MNIQNLAANTIRILSAEAIQKANSGHPGLPMGMADVATILWTEFLIHNPQDPKWISRDRFVLSGGHGSMLIYSLLYLSGYGVSIDDLKSFRQWNSKTPGHPEYGHLDGVETTTGPLGQGFGNSVGMAIASKMLGARFGNLFDKNFIYTFCGDGDLMEGISHETASLAGHLKLNNLIVFYDDNHITIEGHTHLAFSENIEKRFESYGWQVLRTDAYNHDEIRKAIINAQNEKEKPTIIICKSTIGYGSPNKANTHEVHGAPLGKDELLATKKNLNWNYDEEFFVPKEVKDLYEQRKKYLIEEYNKWNEQFTKWQNENKEKAELLKKYLKNWLPENLEEELLNAAPKEANATRSTSSKIIQKIAQLVPNFIGGSADLAPSTNTLMNGFVSISPGKFNGRNFHFGIREHGMGAIVNGIILYGGFKVFGATFFVFSDYMRPTIRLAALMKIPMINVFTHDSIFVGEDGPTHQPVEQLAALRAIPNSVVIRPADGIETAMAWAYALRKTDGPVSLILTRQKIDSFEREKDFKPEDALKGAYIISKEKNEKIDLIISASGSEVPVAVEAKKILENEFSIRVVSIPSKELFEKQNDDYKQSVIPNNVPLVIVEAATMFGWGDLFRQKLLLIGMNSFGSSAPYQVLAEKFGFTGKAVAEKIKQWI
ncbi:transketolase [Stygiobacter electus]|uniref:Transketolase n=1 Tax=Stygiobacter electus TaxID=3032292 RepID=A0AAE3P4J9_9BACT|nr:transketolase [Stygiobacter electus]MDF1613163.1 transketolase [Stygiobacter electus]